MVLADRAAPALRPGRPAADGPAPAAPAPRATGETWTRLGLYVAALLLAFGGLTVLVRDAGWWVAIAGVVILPAAAIGVARQANGRPWVAPLAGVLAGGLVLTTGFARDESLLGVLPTGDSVARWVGLANEGVASIATQRIPATVDPGILFLLAVLALASVVPVAPALDRAPALAAVPLLVVLDVPVAVRAGVADGFWYVLVAVAFLALLRVGRRRMPLAGTAGLAALAIVGSLLAPAVLPPTRTEPRPGGSVFGAGVNPIIDLGENLRRDTIVDALSYTTDAPGGLYLRLATLDSFTGISWEPAADLDADSEPAEPPPPPGLGADVPRVEYSADIAVADVRGRWLPVPYPVTALDGLEGEWLWDPKGLSVRSTGADVRGQEYTATFLDVEPDRSQLLADLPPGADERYLALPELPDLILETAQHVAGAGSTYERAIALQEYFADGDFTYSLEAPVEQGFDGTGIAVIAAFLQERTGYCVHFASAMAVMARAVGIPSRIAVGFQPGERLLVDGRRQYVVTSADLHAWPELYFEGIGWLRFEPTPGRGAPPGYSSLDAVDDPATPEFEGVNPSAAPSLAPDDRPVDPTEESAGADPGTTPGATSRDPLPVVLLAALGAVAVLLVPAATRVGIRLRRLARVRRDRDAAAAWAEIRDTARDHDWLAPDTETVRQLGERLAIVVGTEAVGRLRAGVESAAYAPPGREELTVADVRALRRAIARAAAPRVRLRAVLAPPSLLARVGIGGAALD